MSVTKENATSVATGAMMIPQINAPTRGSELERPDRSSPEIPFMYPPVKPSPPKMARVPPYTWGPPPPKGVRPEVSFMVLQPEVRLTTGDTPPRSKGLRRLF